MIFIVFWMRFATRFSKAANLVSVTYCFAFVRFQPHARMQNALKRVIQPTCFSAFGHIRHRIHSVAVVEAQNNTPHPIWFVALRYFMI